MDGDDAALPGTGGALDRLAELIATAPLNLVARGERPRLRATHIEECVQVGARLAPRPGTRWLDLGTGGGLPGLVLAIGYPEVSWVLLDSVRKKVDAVHAFAQELGLDNVAVLRGRAEEAAHDPEHRAVYDGVVSRAVAGLPVVMELARGFLQDGGQLAVVRGPDGAREAEDARRAAHVLRLRDVHSEEIEQAARPTVLVTMRADGNPPRAYPRPVGTPAAAPLGRGST